MTRSSSNSTPASMISQGHMGSMLHMDDAGASSVSSLPLKGTISA